MGKGKDMLDRLLSWRFWPLFFKELNELRRNRRLIAILVGVSAWRFRKQLN